MREGVLSKYNGPESYQLEIPEEIQTMLVIAGINVLTARVTEQINGHHARVWYYRGEQLQVETARSITYLFTPHRSLDEWKDLVSKMLQDWHE